MIEIAAVAGVATVQDGGRPGSMHQGIPHGGALVPIGLARANARVGNGRDEAAIEIVGTLRLRALAPVHVASDEAQARDLEPLEAWTIECGAARVRYVALRGGLDVAYVLGGRGTLLAGSFGGHEGRPLRKGDILRPGSAEVQRYPLPPLPDPDARIRVVVGPDVERFSRGALDLLLSATFRISPRGDRTGLQLLGPALARLDGDQAGSAPMMRGAIQVLACGEAIVLGPDHPTVGGYPVIATVVSADVGALMARPPGAKVRFVEAGRAAR